MADLTCKELVELVTEYLEGALMPEVRRAFELHLQSCEGCSAYLEQMRQTLELMGTLTEDTITPEMEAELLSAFRDWSRPRG